MTASSLDNVKLADLQLSADKPEHLAILGNWIWLVALAPALLLMSFVALQPWIDPGDLLRDPLAVAELKGTACCKVYDGAVSSLGIAMWVAGAAVSLFAAGVLVVANRSLTRYGLFLLAGGLFTGFLGFDDLFLVHENVLPAFGVPEPITYGTYALIGLAYLAVAWRQILENRYIMFVAAVGLLGASVTIDWFFHSENPWRIIAEDGAKFTGIALWITFHISAAAKGMEKLVRPT